MSALTGATSGQRRHSLTGLSSEQRGLIHHDVDAAATPILLVHGFIENHAIFTVMERALRRRGFQMLTAYDCGLLTHSILGSIFVKLSQHFGDGECDAPVTGQREMTTQ